MAIRVRLQPKEVNVNNDGSEFKIVTGATLSLEVRGSGPLPVGADPKPATIEFFEVKAKGDKAKKARLIATVQCALFAKDGVPKLDHRAGMNLLDVLQYEPLVEDKSDFFIQIKIASKNVENLTSEFVLFLPWEVFEENKQIEVRAVLSVDETPTAKDSDNDTLDVQLHHRDILPDGATARTSAFGILMVYPQGSGHVVKGGKNKLKVFLHQSVVDLCNGLVTDSFDEDGLDQRLNTIFKDAGFSGVTLTIVDDATAGTHFHNRAPRLDPAGKPVTDSQGNPIMDDIRWSALNIDDPNNLDQDSGTELPFFDFWMFHDSEVAPESAEMGRAEVINDLQKIGPKKHVMFPIVIAGSPGSMPFDDYKNMKSDDDRMNVLATLIAHEMAHSFDLHHGLIFNPATTDYSYGGANLPGLIHPRGVMASLFHRNGVSPLKLFGPVHKKELKKFH